MSSCEMPLRLAERFTLLSCAPSVSEKTFDWWSRREREILRMKTQMITQVYKTKPTVPKSKLEMKVAAGEGPSAGFKFSHLDVDWSYVHTSAKMSIPDPPPKITGASIKSGQPGKTRRGARTIEWSNRQVGPQSNREAEVKTGSRELADIWGMSSFRKSFMM